MFPEGRMISHSKSLYRKKYPYNMVVFNAVLLDSSMKQIWHGDLDITFDGAKLKELAGDSVLYVCYENSRTPIWSTNDEIVEITDDYIKTKELEASERARISRINCFKKYRELLKIKKPDVLLPYTEVHINDGIFDIKDIKQEDYEEYGYFTYYVLDRYLSDLFSLKENERIDPSAIWLGRSFNKKLRKIDLKVERMFNPDFKYGDFKRCVTCNYCVPSIEHLDVGMGSYENNVLYLKKNVISKTL